MTDGVVYYDGKSAHVLVCPGEKQLTADAVTAIRDVVVSVTRLPVSSITVAEVNGAPSDGASSGEKRGPDSV